MAVTKIHPIKTTLKKAIDYICNGDKTDDEIYVTIHLCGRENAHKEFELTKKQFKSRTKTIGVNYTEEKIKNRILDKDRKFGNIIDIKNNDKTKFNKGYERWAIKHNMKAVVGTMIIIYEKGFGSMKELEKAIDRNFFEKNELK